ncbi:hypothetical protein LIP91_18730, partial [Erysipelatoclostridium ramosum]|nr:hypothetical protein [Thomasclavelia ramosa]
KDGQAIQQVKDRILRSEEKATLKYQTEKDVKVTVTAPPAVASDEVVVQEEVTNPDGTKSIKNTVKK